MISRRSWRHTAIASSRAWPSCTPNPGAQGRKRLEREVVDDGRTLIGQPRTARASGTRLAVRTRPTRRQPLSRWRSSTSAPASVIALIPEIDDRVLRYAVMPAGEPATSKKTRCYVATQRALVHPERGRCLPGSQEPDLRTRGSGCAHGPPIEERRSSPPVDLSALPPLANPSGIQRRPDRPAKPWTARSPTRQPLRSRGRLLAERPARRGVRGESTAVGELRSGGLRQPDPVAAGWQQIRDLLARRRPRLSARRATLYTPKPLP